MYSSAVDRFAVKVNMGKRRWETKNEIDLLITRRQRSVTDVTVLNRFGVVSDQTAVRQIVWINLKNERTKSLRQTKPNANARKYFKIQAICYFGYEPTNHTRRRNVKQQYYRSNTKRTKILLQQSKTLKD